MNSSFLTEYIYWGLCIFLIVYALIYLMYKKVIVSISDPLNINIVLLAFKIAGLAMTAIILNVNYTFILIVIFLTLYLLAGSIVSWGIKIKYKTLTLNIPLSLQYIVSSSVILLLIVNLVLNYFLGFMPVFSGTQSRALMGSVSLPSLVLLASYFGQISFLFIILSKYRMIRNMNKISFVVFIITTSLWGSKAALFYFPLYLLEYDFILNLKLNADLLPAHKIEIHKKIKKCRRLFVGLSITAIILLPIYLIFLQVGVDITSSYSAIIQRLFSGFDNVMYFVFYDIDIREVEKINIFEIYLYPFVKKIFYTPEFQSAGEYIIYLISNDYVYAKSGMNPNSNLIIELLLALDNLWFVAIFVMAISYFSIKTRHVILSSGIITFKRMIIFTIFVLSPFAILSDGASTIIMFLELFIIYILINTIYNIIIISKRGYVSYKFY